MADEVNATPEPARLAALASAVSDGGTLPPVHLWNPPFCGDIGMKIARDGTWFYRDSPILRPALVRLFSTILRRDPEGYVLVTPVEKIAIEVEDAPFLAVDMRFVPDSAGGQLIFRTNLGDEVAAGPDHPLRFETGPSDGIKPYILVRGDLWALVTRALVYDLVERAEHRHHAGCVQTGVVSGGQFFVMEEAPETPQDGVTGARA